MKRDEFWEMQYKKELAKRKVFQKKCRMLNAQVRNLQDIIDDKK